MAIRLSNRGPALADDMLSVAEADARLQGARCARDDAVRGHDIHAAELAAIRIDQLLDARLYAQLEATAT